MKYVSALSYDLFGPIAILTHGYIVDFDHNNVGSYCFLQHKKLTQLAEIDLQQCKLKELAQLGPDAKREQILTLMKNQNL